MSTVGPGPCHEIAFLHGGSSSQLATLADLRDEGFAVREVYLPDLLRGLDSLHGVSRLFVADRLHPRLWARAAPQAVAVARRGGIVFLSGENSVEQIPGFSATPTPTNYWWWKHGEDPHISIRPISPVPAAQEPAAGQPGAREPASMAGDSLAGRLRAELSDRALRWHHHAVLDEIPASAQVFVTHESPRENGPRGALLVLDASASGGTLVITTMDPVYHHGARFMPGASELLRGVMRWMSTIEPPTIAGREGADVMAQP